MRVRAEVWKPVLGYEGFYEVSNAGRVRSKSRVVIRSNGSPMPVSARILKPGTHEFGYKQVCLYDGKGHSAMTLVQHLVAEAFIGPRPSAEHLVCHNDGDPENNADDNLRYDTQVGNLADRVGHGTANRGEKHGMSKLTDQQAAEIKSLCAAGGMTQRAIAAKFGVSPALVTMIKRGEIRSHV